MKIRLFILSIVIPLILSACHKSSAEEEQENAKTVFVYMPYSNNLTEEFKTNLSDFESAINQIGGLTGRRVIVFFANSKSSANMFEIIYNAGKCSRDTLKAYTAIDCTQESGLASIIADIKSFAPAEKYSMIIGGHGMGWLPVGTSPSRTADQMKYHWDNANGLKTRFFGGTSAETQTEISTLVNSLRNNGVKTDYIMFDDCYMSSLEVAYELREVTDYLIACPTEIMAYGMPYEKLGKYLLSDNPDYEAICNTFYDFYSTYKYPYGTIAVTNCSQLDKLAELMKTANGLYTLDESSSSEIQRMDGYTPVLFYDYGDFVKKLCANDSGFMTQFNSLLNDAVPYKAHTEEYYSTWIEAVPINAYSGITTSEPSTNACASSYKNTSWYKATH